MQQKYELLVLGSGQTHSVASLKTLEDHGYHIQRVSSASRANNIVTTMMTYGQVLHAVLLEIAVDREKCLDLLRWLQLNYPQAIRIVLAGTDELTGLEDLVNSGSIERLLLQPCGEVRLAQAIEDEIRIRETALENSNLNRRVGKLEQEIEVANSNLDARVHEKAEQLIKLIYYDELTGLASRVLLRDRLHHSVESARRDSKKIALFLIGLDRFKYINDSMGQEAGDQVLKEMAERISKCVRSSDTVSRFNGDVFGVLTRDPERVEDPGFVARRILDAIAIPLKIEGQDLFLTASIGISIFPGDADDAGLLQANAETAMRQAKLQARNQFRYYSGEYNQIASKRLSLEAELRRAISQNEFRLFYQPRVDMLSKRVIGAESLLRWQHPDRGIVMPVEFLPILEETDLILTVGDWVLQESVEALRRWRKHELPILRVAVNLSARQFHDRKLPDKIIQIAQQSRLNLAEHQLELEITESLLMEDISTMRAMLNQLHDMGIKIAIDDFGTGYSALSYLISFPLDHLKIDKSFVDKIHKNDDAKAIVEAIISLSYSLHLNVIAEGVETREQLDALQALGCKQFQGYLFARPMPEQDFIALMSKDGGAEIVEQAPEDRLLREPMSNHHSN